MRDGSFSPRRGFIPPDNARYRYRDGSAVDTSPGYHPHRSTRFLHWAQGRRLPELYLDRSECCGCTACAAVCPRDAVAMEPDEEGFLYPVVDAARCVGCLACERACVFKAALTKRWDRRDTDASEGKSHA